MTNELLAALTSKDDRSACALTGKIIEESRTSPVWYAYFDAFASLLDHPKSYVRNRAFFLLAALAPWDESDRLEMALPIFLRHVTDEKPITARQCIKALGQIGCAKGQYVPRILETFKAADFTGYRDSMRPLLERDVEEATQQMTRRDRNE